MRVKNIAFLTVSTLILMLAIGCNNSHFNTLESNIENEALNEDFKLSPLRRCRVRNLHKVSDNVQGPFEASQSKILLTSPNDFTLSSLDSLAMDEQATLSITVDRSCTNSMGIHSLATLELNSHGPVLETIDYDIPDNLTYANAIQQLNDDPCVLYVSQATTMQLYANDPALSQQHHLGALGFLEVAEKIHSSTQGVNREVVLAVIDSGVEASHSDLSKNIWINQDEIANNGRDDDNNGYIDDRIGYNFASRIPSPNPEAANQAHGTHVSGLAASEFNNGVGGSGVLGKNIKIMGLNVFGRSQGATNSNIDNAIRYAADNGADVINMSLGGCGYNASTGQAIAYALQRGVVVVVAAGNSNRPLSANPNDQRNCNGQSSTPVFDTPASFGAQYTGMLTVGSVDAVNIGQKSTFSNYGSSVVKLMAPGAHDSNRQQGLYSTSYRNSYERMSGTSMASPIVAGAAALAIGLLKSRNIAYSPGDIESLLGNSALQLGSLNNISKGSRSLSLKNLVAYIDEKYPVDPNQPDPIRPDPVDPDPINPDPVNPDPVKPDPVRPRPPRRPCRGRRCRPCRRR